MCVLVSFEAIVDSVVKINSLNFGFLIIQSCFWFFLVSQDLIQVKYGAYCIVLFIYESL